MPSDNVTPFRRPPRRVQKKQQEGLGFKTHRGKAVLAHLLTLATYAFAWFFPFPPQPGAPLAFMVASCVTLGFALGAVSLTMANRYDAMPWAATHHEHAVRTLFIGFVIWSVASALTYISPALLVVSIYTHLAIVVWVFIRSGIGLVLAIMRRPIPHPRGALI